MLQGKWRRGTSVPFGNRKTGAVRAYAKSRFFVYLDTSAGKKGDVSYLEAAVEGVYRVNFYYNMYTATSSHMGKLSMDAKMNKCVLPSRIPPLCALVPRVQGSSGAVATAQFVWRGHAKTPTTRAGPWPDFALRLE